jgi:hypothetical protein
MTAGRLCVPLEILARPGAESDHGASRERVVSLRLHFLINPPQTARYVRYVAEATASGAGCRRREMSDWKPGDIANGHVLGEDLVWRPVGGSSESTPAAPMPSAQAPMPPPSAPSDSGQPPKKSHTTRNVILGVIIALFLMCGGCFALVGGSADQFSKEFDKGMSDAMDDPSATDKPEDKPKATANWNTVAELAGNTNKSSPDFHLQGCETRLLYSLAGGDQVLAAFYIEESGKELTKDGGFPVASPSEAGDGETIVHKSEGDYYIEVVAANVNWTAKVQEKC